MSNLYSVSTNLNSNIRNGHKSEYNPTPRTDIRKKFLDEKDSCFMLMHGAIEYRLPREALWLVAAAMTINPVSIFSGNVACLGLQQG